jgi:putative PIN family toxin of toxin-antitoxin system
MNVLIDTKVMVSAVSPFSPYHFIFKALQNEKFTLLISTEIYLEYREVIQVKSKKENLEYLEGIILNGENVKVVEPAFRWNMIKADEDDNNFVDCAVAGNADYLVTNDNHFNILRTISFPKVKVITAEDFLDILNK